MKRHVALLAALCLPGALLALSCGDGGDNEPASPTSKSAVAEETPAATPA